MAQTKKCFVIAPIGSDKSRVRERSDQIFEEVIRPAVEPLGYEPIRSDREAKPGIITAQIIQHIVEDDLVIADLTGHNPNVFYELALRHAVGKPCIQIKDVADKLPFDVAGIRTIDVDYTLVKSLKQCMESIKRQVEYIEKNQGDIESPLGFAASIGSIGKDDAQARLNVNILSKLQEMSTDVQQIKARFGSDVASSPVDNPLGLDNENGWLMCAHCEWPFIQLGKPAIHIVGDDYDKTNPQRTRGNWIEIPCECESCKGITTINVSFHKGNIYPKAFPGTTISQFIEISRTEPSQDTQK